jgi:hypothetical protein
MVEVPIQVEHKYQASSENEIGIITSIPIDEAKRFRV